MEKKYFVKYIPVGGEIKKVEVGTILKIHLAMGTEYIVTSVEGDKYTCDLREGLNNDDTKYGGFGSIKGLKDDEIVGKVKLFLCSRDIQEGDRVRVEWNDGKTTEEIVAKFNYWIEGEPVYKVIGEVSPNAIWVKEGMEFEEDQVQVHVDEYNIFTLKGWFTYHLYKNHVPSFLQFKCFTCGTFH